jgi:hypothetical protein
MGKRADLLMYSLEATDNAIDPANIVPGEKRQYLTREQAKELREIAKARGMAERRVRAIRDMAVEQALRLLGLPATYFEQPARPKSAGEIQLERWKALKDERNGNKKK